MSSREPFPLEKGALAYRDHGRPEVSVVIPAHNEQKLLSQTLGSLHRAVESTRSRVEVIVINNASTDDTPGIAEYAGARVLHEPKKGVSYARQAGLEAAEAPILLGTDADTVVPPTWVDAHVDHYQHPAVLGVAGSYRFMGAHPFYRPIQKSVRSLKRLFRHPFKLLGIRHRAFPPSQSGANFSYRSEVARSIGYVPGVNQGEDTLMGMRIGERGTLVHDDRPNITVHTDGRRFSTIRRILAHEWNIARKQLNGHFHQLESNPSDFTDYR